jgi:hypothetical protein
VRVVAHDHRRRARSAHEFAKEPIDGGGVRGVEFAGGLVGEQQPGPVRDRCADGDSLLLAAREGARPVVGPVGEPDPLEQIVRCAAGVARVVPEQLELERHRLAAGQVGREGARVVLVEQPEIARAERVVDVAQLRPEHAAAAGGEPLETREHAQQGRLAGAARAEHDDDLARLDREVQPLQGDAAAGRGLVDAEGVPDLDHSRLQIARSGESPRKVHLAVSSTMSAAATTSAPRPAAAAIQAASKRSGG